MRWAWVLAAVACSGSSTTSAEQKVSAPSCATRDATYLVTWTEQSGNCGPIPSEVVNINADGTVSYTGSSVFCANSTVTDCTIRNSDCSTDCGGQTCTVTSELTFTPAGNEANGIETITVSGTCTETYGVQWVRQNP